MTHTDETYMIFPDGQRIEFSYWPGSGNYHASIVTDGVETDQWTYVPVKWEHEVSTHWELGLYGAKELIEHLHPNNIDNKKINQIKDLRSASKSFWERISARSNDDYTTATAEIYVGEDTTAYYFFGETHTVKAKITAVKVEGVWKKLHIKFTDRTIKHESRAGLREELSKYLDIMVNAGSGTADMSADEIRRLQGQVKLADDHAERHQQAYELQRADAMLLYKTLAQYAPREVMDEVRGKLIGLGQECSLIVRDEPLTSLLSSAVSSKLSFSPAKS